MLRTIASQKLNKILLREYRPHLLAASVTYEPDSSKQVTRHIYYLRHKSYRHLQQLSCGW